MGRGLGDSGQGEWQPHHARHGTRMDKQPTIIAVHSPSRIRNAIATEFSHSPHLCGRGRELPACPFFNGGPTHYLVPALWALHHSTFSSRINIKYHVSRTMRSHPACRVNGRSADRGGGRRATQIGLRPGHPSRLGSVKAGHDVATSYPTRPICGALSSLRSAVHR